MSRAMAAAAIALALSCAAAPTLLLNQYGGGSAPVDPHQPRPRSKGEKARNRKYRGRS